MKLCKDTSSNITHTIDPKHNIHGHEYSFCGLVGRWPNMVWDCYKFFDGSSELVNCGTCKNMANNYIINKLKGNQS